MSSVLWQHECISFQWLDQYVLVGVEFFQTQYAFDELILSKYIKKLNQLGITNKAHFIVGLGIIKSAKSARWMNANLFGINIPNDIINRIEKSKNEKADRKSTRLNSSH